MSEGVILSPGHPHNYNNNIDKSYRIQVTKGKLIEIKFPEFKLDPDKHCKDYIKLEDGDNTLLLPPVCGVEPPSKIISRSNRVNVFFYSNGLSPKSWQQKIRRWKLIWEESRPLY